MSQNNQQNRRNEISFSFLIQQRKEYFMMKKILAMSFMLGLSMSAWAMEQDEGGHLDDIDQATWVETHTKVHACTFFVNVVCRY